ncbi:uncharacterized protein LOC124634889 [Helicoverpa zea]|uniref:uncharacterized protein LOC124634889 n=1 Tax=Helicoverpa zea TaxID=7113 RepID=UPI001F567205|nr:uncharacterized protein LOC124634889 [Helicoverpa zea]
MAIPNQTNTLFNMNSPESCRNKVYINPNFNRPQRNILPSNGFMHVNPNFPHLVSNIQNRNQSKNKIYVNPNFIKIQGTGDQCMSVAVNHDIGSVPCLYNKTQGPNFQHSVDVEAKAVSQPVAHSRYTLDRRHVIEASIRESVPEKSNKTFQLNKYKTVQWKDVKNNLCGENNVKKHTTQVPIFEEHSHTNHEKNTSINRRKNKFKLVNYENPAKHEKSKINLANIKRNYKSNPVIQTRVKKIKGNLKKNNIPCPSYRKFGKCLRSLRGNCDFLHDKKHISICRKFIKGLCHDSNCLLSHDLTTKKMPTCYFYLQGTCTKAECPYLHVKLNEKTKICPDFVKGYCEKGSKCLQRHVNVSTNTKNKLSSQIKEPFMNKRNPKIIKGINKIERQQTKVMPKMEKRILSSAKSFEDGDEKYSDHNRYYKEQKEDQCTNESCEIKPTRCKLGTLPSFIQL